MERYLKKNNMSQDSLGQEIQKLAKYDRDYKELRFIVCDLKGKTARLAYQGDSKISDTSGKTRLDFLIIMFHLEDDLWKIGYLKKVGTPKIKEDGTVSVLEDVLDDQRFKLN